MFAGPPVVAQLSGADPIPRCVEALAAAAAYLAAARRAVAGRVIRDGAVDPARLDQEQVAAHGYAWCATYQSALAALLDWARRLDDAGRFGELERLILEAAVGEYLAQLRGGVALSQVEIVRPADLGVAAADLRALDHPAIAGLVA